MYRTLTAGQMERARRRDSPLLRYPGPTTPCSTDQLNHRTATASGSSGWEHRLREGGANQRSPAAALRAPSTPCRHDPQDAGRDDIAALARTSSRTNSTSRRSHRGGEYLDSARSLLLQAEPQGRSVREVQQSFFERDQGPRLPTIDGKLLAPCGRGSR